MPQKLGLILGLSALIYTLISVPPTNMSEEAWVTAGIGMMMVSWWTTQVLPIPITSLLPLVLFPIMGISAVREAAAPYAHPVIFLLLGGFIIAIALQRWHLHKRLALIILSVVGDHPYSIIGGFMFASAFLSMWISNTATTIMMMPIAISLAQIMLEGQSKETSDKFTICLLLGIAYASSIGGIGTLIGTPPNAMMAAFMEDTYGINIGFAKWMSFSIPIVCILLPLSWLLLTRMIFTFYLPYTKFSIKTIHKELKSLGPISTAEKRTSVIFILIALAWVTRPAIQQIPGLSELNDTTIALTGAISFFLIPSGSKYKKNSRLLDWTAAKDIPWGILLLFGGGLSLAAMINSSGLAIWLSGVLSVLTNFHVFILILSIITLVVFLTELTSNTATTATLLPILGGIATAVYIDPILLIIPMTLAASCAFMLPVATAPNAIVFSSGQISIPQMARAGTYLNILAITLITPMSYLLIPIIFL
ncbi:MAG: anion transporter [Nitrosomonadaceae bacterium]|nr:anion transporter [Nitrosomonadaceae bacterium]|tara:strand:+ start:288 stop:1721 length:1434 start_codon:yes stop_codon:yes gene_type:complete